jgi:hypothetical protein
MKETYGMTQIKIVWLSIVRYKGERKDLAEIKQEDYGKKEEI